MHEDDFDSSSSSSSSSSHTLDNRVDLDRFQVDQALFYVSSAAKKVDTPSIQKMIDLGTELNLSDNKGYTALHYAAETGSIDVLKLLVKDPDIRLNVENLRKQTPIELAVIYSNVEAISILIHAGCELNMVNCFGKTLLNCIFARPKKDVLEYYEIAKLLLENGADPNIPDREYDLPLNQSILFHRYLRSEEQYNDWLNFVCMFLYYGADVNTPNSAYLCALQVRNKDLLNILFDYVVDFNQCTLYDDSLFIEAIEMKDENVFEMINRGADINFWGENDKTCMTVAYGYTTPNLLLYILRNCDDDLMSSFDLKHFIFNYKFCAESFFLCLEEVFKHKNIGEIFERFSDFNPLMFMYLFTRLNELKIDKRKYLGLLYILLSYVNFMFSQELILIYDMVGYTELFEAFLKVNVELLNTPDIFENHHFACICYPNLFSPKSNGVPTLQALSRNAFRSNIRRDLICGDDLLFFKYYNCVQNMFIPQRIKDIICLKVPV